MKQDNILTGRQKDILKIIIISHIQSAAPIGSASISDILNLSSATIRNTMGELEDMGYLSKPHTSAGRIPTSSGYRFYVNNLLQLGSISDRQKRFIEKKYYTEDMDSVEAMLERMSHLLSIMTHYAGITCMSNLKFYIEGTSNMIDMPEFRSPGRMKCLLRLFDEKTELMRLLNEDLAKDGVKIHIGDEERFEMLREMSLIIGNYKIGQSERGSLGVLGPMRMDYSTLIPLVDFLSETIEAVLNEMEIGSDQSEREES